MIRGVVIKRSNPPSRLDVTAFMLRPVAAAYLQTQVFVLQNNFAMEH